MLQNIVVGIIILAALIYTVRRLRKNTSGGGCGCGCSGCSGAGKNCSDEFKLTKLDKRDD